MCRRSTPTISWRKNGTKIAIAKEEAAFDIPWGFQNRLLNITKVRKDQHEDMYSCEAEVNETSVLKYSFTLKVEGDVFIVIFIIVIVQLLLYF